MTMSDPTTQFGFENIPRDEKTSRVRAVFDSVVDRYDLMNDLMSLGVHRLWKRFAVGVSGVTEGQRVLDLAGGTGDLACLLARRTGHSGSVVLADINRAMLEAGRRRLVDAGLVGNVHYVQADAERLPFSESSFDCITMAFGLRNVTDMSAALRGAYRALRPAGRALILEFSRVTIPAVSRLYDAYSFRVLPWLGRVVAHDSDAYRYLAESIRVHPDQEQLKALLEDAGFEHCEYFNLSAGIVAVHRGYKL
ncbi:MAG: bifunctional demethylmenaquinone methyltransferase/2-methoxy-6-polyprenyl-1,4-benzoquinol methylase UbiE [Gammaproteobacteria bacterium]|nr:bifunctional demethylmenaquinone methyltransferase/2-methoxy-6-polyprenyl-1,4-benzoquinol methylase UbiE [Gammaproteobacteria bacterium]NIR81834.1 bifunctional demethylmenaquinone methyltransferase/2-methoxy-6-polyprenyl-1,4-benzoquinol methylase UbiE [Gammaproteobacteria bacterium]NIR88666.1 bifunctional demethylmenaquinone methyltransferase/2-methoxy-6-polyprenyl-1,4-benzoquinol methylase UbiE [Gammaproteobacteria bacterium]NIU02942.1 bifunctional demethylmenaquinone methyltransferase/2-met